MHCAECGTPLGEYYVRYGDGRITCPDSIGCMGRKKAREGMQGVQAIMQAQTAAMAESTLFTCKLCERLFHHRPLRAGDFLPDLCPGCEGRRATALEGLTKRYGDLRVQVLSEDMHRLDIFYGIEALPYRRIPAEAGWRWQP